MQQRQGICQQQFTETEVVPNPFSGHLRKGKTHQLNFIIYGKEKKKASVPEEQSLYQWWYYAQHVVVSLSNQVAYRL